MELTLYCDHISASSVHCNRYTTIHITDFDRTIREYIEMSDWALVDGEPRCEDHK